MKRLALALLTCASLTACGANAAVLGPEASEGLEASPSGKADRTTDSGQEAAPLEVGALSFKLERDGEEAIARLPVVRGGAPGVAERINAQLTAETLLGDTLEAIEAQFQEYGTGLTGADFEVTLNARGLLSLKVGVEWLAAYPSYNTTPLVFDTTDGARLTGAQMFDAQKRAELVALLNQKLEPAVAEARAQALEEDPENASLFENVAFRDGQLDTFFATDAGIDFLWTAGFPHVAQALEPDANLALTWEEAAPFLAERYRTR